jgi:hypothetical protein
MTNNTRRTFGRTMLQLVAGALASLAAMGAQAQGVVVTTESIEVSPGGFPEVTISVQSAQEQPTALVLFYAYDPALLSPYTGYYETIARDTLGNVQRDADGNAITFRSAVRPEAALAQAGKSLDVQIYAEGVIGIAISGINSTPIPSGAVCTIGFRAQPGTNPATSSLLRGITSASPVTVTNPNTGASEEAASSATTANERKLDISFFGGSLLFSCGNNINRVGGLAASDSEADFAAITWTSGGGTSEYRVFRSNDSIFANAVPLGNGWQVALSFSDFSAAPSTGGGSSRGCFGSRGGSGGTPQYYWVIARDADGCESTPAGPVQGSRAPAEKEETASAAVMGDAAMALLLCGALLATAARRRFFSTH